MISTEEVALRCWLDAPGCLINGLCHSGAGRAQARCHHSGWFSGYPFDGKSGPVEVAKHARATALGHISPGVPFALKTPLSNNGERTTAGGILRTVRVSPDVSTGQRRTVCTHNSPGCRSGRCGRLYDGRRPQRCLMVVSSPRGPPSLACADHGVAEIICGDARLRVTAASEECSMTPL